MTYVPAVVVRRFPEDSIDTSVGGVVYILGIIRSYDVRQGHAAICTERIPVRKSAAWYCYLCERINKGIIVGSPRDHTISWEERHTKKEDSKS